MPALILIVPLIAAYIDQREPKQIAPIMRSYDLPPNTEIIYFVAEGGR